MDVIIFLQTTIIATNFPIMENKNKKTLQFSWPYKRKNYVLFGVGVFVIIVGYLIMYSGEVDSFQSLVISPLLLVVQLVRTPACQAGGRGFESRLSRNFQ